jgi:glycosyltransferase involved in cell wall biosynthesis
VKIGYVLRSLEDSGVTVYVLRLADAMRRRGHDVFLVSDGGIYENEVRSRELRHHLLPLCRGPLRSYLAARQLSDVVRRERPDILHGNWRRAQLACHLAEKKLGVQFVTTLHLVGIPDNWLYRRLTYWGRRVIAPCSEAVTYLVRTFGVSEEKIHLVFHGVDPDEWPRANAATRRRARGNLGLGADAAVMVSVARLEPIKGHDVMLRAMAAARKQAGRLRLLLVGAGSSEQDLKRLATECGLADAVHFLGYGDPRPALAAADLFVLTSQRESFGFAPVEAMLSGLPVLRTDSHGARDQVVEGETGRVVPVGDVDAVAQAMVEFATSPDRWQAMGDAGRGRALEHFTLVRMAERVEQIYNEVLAETPRRR